MAYMQKMEHWLGDIPSPQTRKNYRNGIKSFAEYYGYGEATAEQAKKIFVYLCKQSDIVLSKELTEPEVKVGKSKKEKREVSSKEAKQGVSRATEGMHKIEWGDTILIYLKQSEDKNERIKLANQARKLIDMYCEE